MISTETCVWLCGLACLAGMLFMAVGLGIVHRRIDRACRAFWLEEVRYWRGRAGRPMRDWREASRN